MSVCRAIICIILPPVAVLDKGCGVVLLVTALTLVAWVPGAIAALVICMLDEARQEQLEMIQRQSVRKEKNDDAIDIDAKEL